MGGITRTQIEQRKQELEQQRDQLIANANAVTGAIQDCDHWLALLASNDTEITTHGDDLHGPASVRL